MTKSTQESIELKWKLLAAQAREQAQALPAGKERDELNKKARQLDTASQMNLWLSSRGLQPPTSR
jgi:hypothetical protein